MLLTSDFTKLVLLANVIAWPVAYYFMRGHGGITARVLADGHIAIGDPVTLANSKPVGTST